MPTALFRFRKIVGSTPAVKSSRTSLVRRTGRQFLASTRSGRCRRRHLFEKPDIQLNNCDGGWVRGNREPFCGAERTIGSFRGTASFESWLYRLGLLGALRTPESSALDAVLRSETNSQIQTVVASLPPEQRMVIVLRYTQGLSYEEIAVIPGCSPGTVASRLSRAHKVLERRLSRFSGAGEKIMYDFEAMLERELTIQLRLVAAPASLWDRIHDRGSDIRCDRSGMRGSVGLILLPAAAIMLLILSIGPLLPDFSRPDFRVECARSTLRSCAVRRRRSAERLHSLPRVRYCGSQALIAG